MGNKAFEQGEREAEEEDNEEQVFIRRSKVLLVAICFACCYVRVAHNLTNYLRKRVKYRESYHCQSFRSGSEYISQTLYFLNFRESIAQSISGKYAFNY